MAKKKSKSFNNKQFKRFQPAILLVVGVAAGFLLAKVQPPNLRPDNLVWAGNSEVKVPGDLAEFLTVQDQCLGSDKDGVGLWSVYQVSQDKFAKVAYGCGVGLTRYVMAVKPDRKWQLLNPNEYFGANLIPKCALIDQYKIDKSIEPFCLEADGSPRQNTL